MKKIIFIVLCLVLFLSACQEKKKSSVEQTKQQTIDFYACQEDSECLKIDKGCCSCYNGGQSTAINLKYQKDWQKINQNNCQDILCPAIYNCHKNQIVKCEENKCVLKIE